MGFLDRDHLGNDTPQVYHWPVRRARIRGMFHSTACGFARGWEVERPCEPARNGSAVPWQLPSSIGSGCRGRWSVPNGWQGWTTDGSERCPVLHPLSSRAIRWPNQARGPCRIGCGYSHLLSRSVDYVPAKCGTSRTRPTHPNYAAARRCHMCRSRVGCTPCPRRSSAGWDRVFRVPRGSDCACRRLR